MCNSECVHIHTCTHTHSLRHSIFTATTYGRARLTATKYTMNHGASLPCCNAARASRPLTSLTTASRLANCLYVNSVHMWVQVRVHVCACVVAWMQLFVLFFLHTHQSECLKEAPIDVYSRSMCDTHMHPRDATWHSHAPTRHSHAPTWHSHAPTWHSHAPTWHSTLEVCVTLTCTHVTLTCILVPISADFCERERAEVHPSLICCRSSPEPWADNHTWRNVDFPYLCVHLYVPTRSLKRGYTDWAVEHVAGISAEHDSISAAP